MRIILTGSQKESVKAIPADILILSTILILFLGVKVQGLVPIGPRTGYRVPDGVGQGPLMLMESNPSSSTFTSFPFSLCQIRAPIAHLEYLTIRSMVPYNEINKRPHLSCKVHASWYVRAIQSRGSAAVDQKVFIYSRKRCSWR
jgi:hypothetical protein